MPLFRHVSLAAVAVVTLGTLLSACVFLPATQTSESEGSDPESVVAATVWQSKAIPDFDGSEYEADEDALDALELLLEEHDIRGGYETTPSECNDGGLSTMIEYTVSSGSTYDISVCDPDPIASDFHAWAESVRDS